MSEPATTSSRPLVSIVVEGYNESRSFGTAHNTIEALKRQDFPLERVEIILVGNAAEGAEWRRSYTSPAPFAAIKIVEDEGAQYYALKNKGAQEAAGDIIAFTDSDVFPASTWLAAIVQTITEGADVAVGLSLFKSADGWDANDILRQIAVSITFGYILGRMRQGGSPEVRGFMDHNVALRADLFHRLQYREDLGRILASPLLFRALMHSGARIALHPGQQIVHYFSWGYWLSKLHFRYGYEVFVLRRLDKSYPNQWIARTRLFEPVVTMLWHMLLDLPRWLRFSKLLGVGATRRLALLPVVVALSGVARTTEMLGMYSTMVAPGAMRRWAETV
jgi:glycosyltransferase involved in cell wall biosynthesis